MVSVVNSALKALIVEEDEYFTLQLATLIQAIGYPVIHIIEDHTEALTAISTFLPDLVIMGLDSPAKQLLFNYAESLKHRAPPILFITDFNKKDFYASQKVLFKTNEENIRKVIKKKVGDLESNQRIGNNILRYKGFLFFAKRGIYDKVKITDILYFKAVDDYALIYTPTKVVTIFTGIKELKKLLKEDLFIQVHRSYFINAQKEITTDLDKNNLYINDTYIVPLSRRLKKDVLGWFKTLNIPLSIQR